MNELGRISHWVFTWGLPLLAAVWLYRRRTRGRLLFCCGLVVAAMAQGAMRLLLGGVTQARIAEAGAMAGYWRSHIGLVVVYYSGMIVALVGFARIVRQEDNETELGR